jgi:ribonuclease-3
MEEEPTMLVPDPEKEQEDFMIRSQESGVGSQEDSPDAGLQDEGDLTPPSTLHLSPEEDPDFDLSHITHKEKSREDIIAEAEAAAFAED